MGLNTSINYISPDIGSTEDLKFRATFALIAALLALAAAVLSLVAELVEE